jgi:HSP20 family protein
MKELAPFRKLTPFLRWPLGDIDSYWRRVFEPAEEGELAWAPTVDVVEEPAAYVVRAEIPGLKAEEIDLSVTGDVLTLKGEKKREEKKETEHGQLLERRYGAFHRSFAFDTPVDPENVEAELVDGVLTVRVMKKEESKQSKIAIKGS